MKKNHDVAHLGARFNQTGALLVDDHSPIWVCNPTLTVAHILLHQPQIGKVWDDSKKKNVDKPALCGAP